MKLPGVLVWQTGSPEPTLEPFPTTPRFSASRAYSKQVTRRAQGLLQRLDDYLDRELSADDLQLVERHLEECSDCASRYRFEIRLIHDIRARLRRIAPPGDLMTRIKLRLDAETAG
ncbi:MAG: anti-sigma factor family protein [Gemmatimonadales bacterium]